MGTKARKKNDDIRKRDQELLQSFMNTKESTRSSLETINPSTKSNEKNKSGKVEESQNSKRGSKHKGSSNIGQKLKKETYKIKFKVDIGGGEMAHSHSKHSVLHYLFGCFGGQKFFTSYENQ